MLMNEYLKSFSTESIKETIRETPDELNEFGYNFDRKSTVDIIQFKNIQYDQKYSGDLNNYFHLIIKRKFYVKTIVKNESNKATLFKETLVCEGRAYFKNLGNGEVESYPDQFSPTIRLRFCRPKDSRVNMNIDMIDFEGEDFPI